jgi:hypothetical protein
MSCNCNRNHNIKIQEKYSYSENQPKVGTQIKLQPYNSFTPATMEKYPNANYHRPNDKSEKNDKWAGV